MTQSKQDVLTLIGEASFDTTAVAGIPFDYKESDAGKANALNTYVRLNRIEVKDAKIKAIFNCRVQDGASSFGMAAETVMRTAESMKKIAEDMDNHPFQYNVRQFALAAALCQLGEDVIKRNGGAIGPDQIDLLQGEGGHMHTTQSFFSRLHL